ncbi:MAG: tetratricopeptide repeat protein [Nitrospirota bacterium]
MIRKAIIAFSMLALCITTAAAQETKGSGTSSWFKELQKRIDIISPRKKLSVSTGVAGVRGAKDDNGRSKLYWKGKKGEESVTEAELAEFKEALAYAEAGKRSEAIHEFEEFLKQYPDSALVPDAKKSLDMIKMEAKAEQVPEAKTEPKAEKAETQPEVKAEPKPEPKAEAK